MARQTLPTALKLMFGHEGGYSNVATDAGGPTKYGVTHKTLAAHRGVPSVTAEQVKALTIEEATEIYTKGYWTQSGGDILPRGLDYAVFDFGVNSGPVTAVRRLQRLLGVKADGSVGPQTLAAVNAYQGGVGALIVDYCEDRMKYLRSLTNPKTGFPVNGRGWTIRVTGVDPKGQWRKSPGVVGHAVALFQFNAPSRELDLTHPITAGGTSKAEAAKQNEWMKPETVLQGVGAAGGLSFLATGSGPVQWAVGFAIVCAAVFAAVLIVRHSRAIA